MRAGPAAPAPCSRDVSVSGDEITVTFPAKSGKVASYSLTDAQLARAIDTGQDHQGQAPPDVSRRRGQPRAVRAGRDQFIPPRHRRRSRYGKGLPHLHASALAAALAKLEPGESATARKRQVATVTKSVAAFLRNTPAITRASYIAPCLFSMFEKRTLSDMWAAVERRDGLRVREAKLAAVLEAVG